MHCGAKMVYAVLSRLARAGFTGQVVSEGEIKYQTYKSLRKDVLLFADWQRREYRAPHAIEWLSFRGGTTLFFR